MRVEVLRSTEEPERLVCQAARGDYYDGYVGDTRYEELMEDVEYKDDHLKRAIEDARVEMLGNPLDISHLTESSQREIVTSARTRAFIEKQLSRGHYGPWEHPQITFTVEGVSRVTMAQITRHRLMSFDVQSQRYVDFSDKDQKVAMPRSLEDPAHFSRETGTVELDEGDREWHQIQYLDHVNDAFRRYQNMIEAGVPKEDARFVLPLGTVVNMSFSGNARTFMHLLDMRKKANAQWEIRELSEKLLDELFDWMPHTFEYYEEHGPNKLAP